ncbi:hypothetical protein DXG01_003000, partial [Tephrocybe rancida]
PEDCAACKVVPKEEFDDLFNMSDETKEPGAAQNQVLTEGVPKSPSTTPAMVSSDSIDPTFLKVIVLGASNNSGQSGNKQGKSDVQMALAAPRIQSPATATTQLMSEPHIATTQLMSEPNFAATHEKAHNNLLAHHASISPAAEVMPVMRLPPVNASDLELIPIDNEAMREGIAYLMAKEWGTVWEDLVPVLYSPPLVQVDSTWTPVDRNESSGVRPESTQTLTSHKF